MRLRAKTDRNHGEIDPMEIALDEHIEEMMVDEFVKESMPSKCELRPGIGLCDSCGLPKWPQEYCGLGHMVCLDCLAAGK